MSFFSSLIFLATILGLAYLREDAALAVYGVSFWHYCLYGLAYTYGAVELTVFRRDAIVMKSAALLALACVYLAAPWCPLSLTAVGAGFLLNGLAARVLGSDRTYYGHEVADLPPLRVTAFPYSWIGHPMLVGNMAAYGGTLLNAEFRRQWWPLACAHVALNLGLLLMELYVTPQRRHARGSIGPAATGRGRWLALGTGCGIGAAGAVGGAALYAGSEWGYPTLSGAAAGACSTTYAYVLYRYYAGPRSVPIHRDDLQQEECRER